MIPFVLGFFFAKVWRHALDDFHICFALAVAFGIVVGLLYVVIYILLVILI